MAAPNSTSSKPASVKPHDSMLTPSNLRMSRTGTPIGIQLGPLFAHGASRQWDSISTAVLEAPALVTGFDNIAVMSQSIQQRGCHLGVAEDARPFGEGEIGGDDDRGALVEPADQMKEELAAGLGEGQIAELVEHDEVHAGEVIGEPSLPAGAGLALQPVHQVEDDVEAASCAATDARSRDGHGEMRFAGAGSADQDGVALLGQEGTGCQTADQTFVDR